MDQASTHGTYLNGEQLVPRKYRQVTSGDIITLGKRLQHPSHPGSVHDPLDLAVGLVEMQVGGAMGFGQSQRSASKNSNSFHAPDDDEDDEPEIPSGPRSLRTTLLRKKLSISGQGSRLTPSELFEFLQDEEEGDFREEALSDKEIEEDCESCDASSIIDSDDDEDMDIEEAQIPTDPAKHETSVSNEHDENDGFHYFEYDKDGKKSMIYDTQSANV